MHSWLYCILGHLLQRLVLRYELKYRLYLLNVVSPVMRISSELHHPAYFNRQKNHNRL